LPCVAPFSPVALKTFGRLAVNKTHFYLVHPDLIPSMMLRASSMP
jgi:hypothetical protein